MKYEIREGNYQKLGIELKKDGVIFTFEGEQEEACSLLLHDEVTGEDSILELPSEYCIGALRSVLVKGIDIDHTGYLYVKDGKEYMDPYAYGVMGRDLYNDHSRGKHNFRVYGRLSEPKLPSKPMHGLEIPKGQMLIYKLHVRGFTMDKGAKGAAMGTFEGIRQRIPYIKSLGVTSLELMPCYEYEELFLQKVSKNKYSCKKLPNYWGYTEGQYFAVKASYAKNPSKAGTEFAKLIHALHEAGIEVIMEMYFPDNVNQNLILEVLQFWVKYYHVDGFRLVGLHIPILAIVQNSYLARTKILYGDFPEETWKLDKKYKRLYVDKEEYLYPARQILNHINGNMCAFVDQQKKQNPDRGYINYLASNNGFTFMDTLMYNDRHNEENGENNYDGSSANFSHNYGEEGPSKKKLVQSLRKRQWKNGMAMLFMAQGVPMLLAGDEFGNSKGGNNNAYCQDNPIGWVNWKNQKSHQEELAFVRALKEIRDQYPVVAKSQPFEFIDRKAVGIPDLSYHGANAWITGVVGDSMAIGMLYAGAYSEAADKQDDVYVAYNFYASQVELAIPHIARKKWQVKLTTGQAEITEDDRMVRLDGHCICILTSSELPGQEKRNKR